MGELIVVETKAEVLETSEEEKIRQGAIALVSNAQQAIQKIEDNEDYVSACQFEKDIKKAIKETKDYFGPKKAERRAAWQERIDQERAVLDILEAQLERVVDARLAFENEAERKRQEKEREVNLAAAKEASKQAKEIAAVLRESGEEKLAEELVKSAAAPIVSVKSDLPKVAGISSREAPWKYRVVDLTKVNKQFLKTIIDDDLVKGVVRSMGRDAEKVVGGIQVFRDKDMVSTSRVR